MVFALAFAWGCSSSSDETPGAGGKAGASGQDAGDCYVTGCPAGLTCCIGQPGGLECSTSCGSGGTSSGGSAGSAGAASGGAAGSGGVAGAACATLFDDFSAAFSEAKACPLTSSEPVCDLLVDSSIDGCGQYTFVQASNAQALQDLDGAKKAWAKLGCDAAGSCALGGAAAQSATCEANGQGGMGTCVSHF